MCSIRLMAVLTLMLGMPVALGADNLQAFPPAETGAVRYVLQLPPREDESAFRVELMVGKTVLVDKENKYFLGGSIQKEMIPGWGFGRYLVTKLGPMAGTMMAVDSRVPKVLRFVTLGGDPYLIRYNSRLPVVVYVPDGAEVRYRIWRAAPEVLVMEKG